MLLRKDDPWIRELPIPDVRDWRVVDVDGRTVGFVQSIAFDTQDKRFEAILTGPNERFPADQLDVGDHVVTLRVPVDGGSGGRSQREETYDDRQGAGRPSARRVRFDHAARDHFARTYAHTDRSYDDLFPAYLFGRQMALDADFAGRPFHRAEEDLSAHWVALGYSEPFQSVAEAVRFGYELRS